MFEVADVGRRDVCSLSVAGYAAAHDTPQQRASRRHSGLLNSKGQLMDAQKICTPIRTWVMVRVREDIRRKWSALT